jgi:ubiquinone/menaquinone biosynthesis C-methylase UbiE
MENSDPFINIASYYDDYRVSHENFSNYILSKIDVFSKSIIIDVGCGTGNETVVLFSKFGCKVIGIDPSKEMLKKAKEKTDKISWISAYAEEIPFANDSCNIITSFFSVHYFHNLVKVVNEFYRILKVNGKIFIFTLSHEQLKTLKEYEFFPSLFQIDRDKLPDLKFIESIFKTNGFKTSFESIFYQNIKIDENYIRMVNNRYRVSFNKLSDNEINTGIEQIRKEISEKGSWMEKVYCTVIIAEKLE